MKLQYVMEERQDKVFTLITSECLDCTDANATTVLRYYRSNVPIKLPWSKYLMFMHWISNDLFHKATTIHEIVSDKHIANKSGDTVYFRCTFIEKKK